MTTKKINMQAQTSSNHQIRIPIVDFLNQLVQKVAGTVAWVNVALIGIILAQVILRYGFNNGLVALEELIWHFYAVAFMFGVSYAITTDSHIRVDIAHTILSTKSKRIIEIVGVLFLLMPFAIIILDHSLSWVWESYRVLESSSNPTGLGYRWIIKSVIPLSMALILIAALARLIEQIVLLANHQNTEHGYISPGRVSMVRKLFAPQVLDCEKSEND